MPVEEPRLASHLRDDAAFPADAPAHREAARTLDDHLAATTRDARTRSILVLGAPGAGKTHLLSRLRVRAARHACFVGISGAPAGDVLGAALQAAVFDLRHRDEGLPGQTPGLSRPQLASFVDPLLAAAAPFVLGADLASISAFLTPEALDETPALATRILAQRFVPALAASVPEAPAELVAALLAERSGGPEDAPPLAAVARALGPVAFFRAIGALAARASVPVILAFDRNEMVGARALASALETLRAGSGLLLLATLRLEDWNAGRAQLGDSERQRLEEQRLTLEADASLALPARDDPSGPALNPARDGLAALPLGLAALPPGNEPKKRRTRTPRRRSGLIPRRWPMGAPPAAPAPAPPLAAAPIAAAPVVALAAPTPPPPPAEAPIVAALPAAPAAAPVPASEAPPAASAAPSTPGTVSCALDVAVKPAFAEALRQSIKNRPGRAPSVTILPVPTKGPGIPGPAAATAAGAMAAGATPAGATTAAATAAAATTPAKRSTDASREAVSGLSRPRAAWRGSLGRGLLATSLVFFVASLGVLGRRDAPRTLPTQVSRWVYRPSGPGTPVAPRSNPIVLHPTNPQRPAVNGSTHVPPRPAPHAAAPSPGMPMVPVRTDPPAPQAPATPPAAEQPAPGTPDLGSAQVPLDREVDAAADLFGRLKVIDKALTTRDSQEVLATIERLMDNPPGSPEDQRALRIAFLGRLAVYKDDPRAMTRLETFMEPSYSRAERLVAIEALTRDGVPGIAQPQLMRIATADTDDVVQKKARQVLGLPD
jgi:hypothetical protein